MVGALAWTAVAVSWQWAERRSVPGLLALTSVMLVIGSALVLLSVLTAVATIAWSVGAARREGLWWRR